MAGTKYYKVTEKELMALIAAADSCNAMSGAFNDEQNACKRLLSQLQSVTVQSFFETTLTLKPNIRGNRRAALNGLLNRLS